ncbi:9942_t:CDS:2, partial [Gigaspora margarita]
IWHAFLEADVNVRLVRNLRNNVKIAVNIQDLATGINKRRAASDELCGLVEPGIEPYKPKKVQTIHEGVEKFKKDGLEIVIVDISGRHKQETELFEEMKQISSVVAKAFHEAADIGSIIITKMDGHAKGEKNTSCFLRSSFPIDIVKNVFNQIIFIGTGKHIHDLEILNLGDLYKKCWEWAPDGCKDVSQRYLLNNYNKNGTNVEDASSWYAGYEQYDETDCGGLRGMPDLSQMQNMMKQMGLVVYQIWKIDDKFYSLCFILKTTKYAN